MKSAALLLVLLPTSVTAGVAGDWLDAATICRVAIESGEPLATDDLTPGSSDDASAFEIPPTTINTGDRVVTIHPGVPAPQKIWESREGLFWLFARERRGGTDLCEVHPRGDLEEGDILRIVASFSTEKARLFSDGTHIPANTTPLVEQTSLAFAPVARAPSGRCIISVLWLNHSNAADVDISFMTGQQMRGICASEGDR